MWRFLSCALFVLCGCLAVGNNGLPMRKETLATITSRFVSPQPDIFCDLVTRCFEGLPQSR